MWSVLMERNLSNEAVASLLDVAAVCGYNEFERITLGYMRVEMARNLIIQGFLEHTSNPDDVLVMLDADHTHPPNVVLQLASVPHELGVCGALAFRRGGNFDPCWFVRDENGDLHAPMKWNKGQVYQCDAVGTGAIAIKRWVFTKLDESGWKWPYFRYEYPEKGAVPSEDIVFAKACSKAGIYHYCDTGLITPHISTRLIQGDEWAAFVEQHIEQGIEV